jgi:hypothetical protein
MVDIFLELPDDLIRAYTRKASAVGSDSKTLMRKAIERSAVGLPVADCDENAPLSDEPIVKAAEIEVEYRRLGYERGWRFMMCPQANAASARLLVVTLNPGGRGVHGTTWSHEAGNAYCVEDWGSAEPGKAKLQLQMQAMYRLLGARDDEVFTANYVPFRSPTWRDLERRPEAMAFAGKLWTWLLPKLSFDLAVCIGKYEPGRSLAALLNAELEARVKIGWGTVTADRYRLPDGRLFVALPHLSRFSVFGRGASENGLRELFQL